MEENISVKESKLFSVNDLVLIKIMEDKNIISLDDIVLNERLSEEEETKESLEYLGIRNMLLFSSDQELLKSIQK